MGQLKLVTFVVISAVAALVGGTSDAEPDPQVLVKNAIKLIRLVNDPTAIHFSLVQYFGLWQGSLTEGVGSAQLISLYKLV